MLLNEAQKLKKIKAHYVPCKTLGRQTNKTIVLFIMRKLLELGASYRSPVKIHDSSWEVSKN